MKISTAVKYVSVVLLGLVVGIILAFQFQKYSGGSELYDVGGMRQTLTSLFGAGVDVDEKVRVAAALTTANTLPLSDMRNEEASEASAALHDTQPTPPPPTTSVEQRGSSLRYGRSTTVAVAAEDAEFDKISEDVFRLRESVSKVAASSQHHNDPPVLPKAGEGKRSSRDSSSSHVPADKGATPQAKSASAAPAASMKPTASRSGCPYDFTVYVYELPPYLESVRIAEEARANQTLHVCQKCILEQFALEYIIHDFFLGFCGRTTKPEEADFFYLPIIRDAEFRVAMDPSTKGAKDRRAPSQTETALLTLFEKGDSKQWMQYFQLTDTWWKRHDGADHIVVMPAPVTNLRHQGGMRGFFHYMSHLSAPIFLNVEYSLSFVREYPKCSSLKNIVVPYPTTDPALFNGKLHSDPVERHSLLYYAGGMHGDCVGVRRALKQIMHNGTMISKEHIVPKYGSNMKEREHGFRAATFCPIPIGDSPSSKRMYDVMHFGCIPVILSDDLVYAYTSETGGDLDETRFSIRIPQSVVQFPTDYLLKKFSSPKAQKLFGFLPDGTSLYGLLQKADTLPRYEDGIYLNPLIHILRMVSEENLRILRQGVEKAAPFFRYYDMDPLMRTIPTAEKRLPGGGALQALSAALSKRKRYGIDKIHEECTAEKGQKHAYKGNYPCDKDDGNSLYRRRLFRQGREREMETGKVNGSRWLGDSGSDPWRLSTADADREEMDAASGNRKYLAQRSAGTSLETARSQTSPCDAYFRDGETTAGMQSSEGRQANHSVPCKYCGDWAIVQEMR